MKKLLLFLITLWCTVACASLWYSAAPTATDNATLGEGTAAKP